jgi:hypothetical protein
MSLSESKCKGSHGQILSGKPYDLMCFDITTLVGIIAGGQLVGHSMVWGSGNGGGSSWVQGGRERTYLCTG